MVILKKGYLALEQMGAIKETDDFEQTRANVAQEYTNCLKAKENVLIVATTHNQGKAVTEYHSIANERRRPFK